MQCMLHACDQRRHLQTLFADSPYLLSIVFVSISKQNFVIDVKVAQRILVFLRIFRPEFFSGIPQMNFSSIFFSILGTGYGNVASGVASGPEVVLKNPK